MNCLAFEFTNVLIRWVSDIAIWGCNRFTKRNWNCFAFMQCSVIVKIQKCYCQLFITGIFFQRLLWIGPKPVLKPWWQLLRVCNLVFLILFSANYVNIGLDWRSAHPLWIAVINIYIAVILTLKIFYTVQWIKWHSHTKPNSVNRLHVKSTLVNPYQLCVLTSSGKLT